MVRQARSEATRRKILDAAVEVFRRDGYPAGLNVILGHAQLTKGALYYHFDSEKAVAAAIVDEASSAFLNSFDAVCRTPSPALENMIHGVFAVVQIFNSDPLARTGGRLITALGADAEVSAIHRSWIAAMTDQVKKAIAEGDIRPDLDAASVAEVIVSALLGARELEPGGGNGLVRRATTVWEILLPAIVTDDAIEYFREYLSRESLRHIR